MIERKQFIIRWKKEFGCECSSPICWCDSSIKLGFLYDWLMDRVSDDVSRYITKDAMSSGRIVKGSIGEALLPSFMKNRDYSDGRCDCYFCRKDPGSDE